MADEKPKTVTVEALQWHSYNGQNYAVGDTYDIDEQFADSVAIQGKAVRVDRVAVAKAQAKATTTPAAKKTTVVKPMALKTKDVTAKTLKTSTAAKKKTRR